MITDAENWDISTATMSQAEVDLALGLRKKATSLDRKSTKPIQDIDDVKAGHYAEVLDKRYAGAREIQPANGTKYSRLERRADGRVYVKNDFPELPTQAEVDESEPTQMIMPQKPEEYGEPTQAISPVQEYGEPTQAIEEIVESEPTQMIMPQKPEEYGEPTQAISPVGEESEQTIEYAIKPEVIEEGLDSESQKLDKGVHEALEELLAKEQEENPIEITDIEEINDDFDFPDYS